MDNQHQICVNTIKGLAMDAVQKANSGHPGMPMGAADMAVVLWRHFLQHDPADPEWPDRDRFVLSAGHGSMLLYSLLHLSGYDLSLDDIKDFRQWGSKTPGHPEVGHTPGVETTTGPLGQGFANGVGMAITERLMRETFGEELCDHYTYAIVSDGDLMEGLSYEAASLAGHLGLGRIVYLYDDNEITIDGNTSISFTEDRGASLEAAGWHIQRVDGHDPDAIAAAIRAAREETERPSLICCRTAIGQSSPLEGTSKSHGAPLGEDNILVTKRVIGLDPQQDFYVPDAAVSAMRDHEGAKKRKAWEARLAEHPKGDELRRWLAGDGQALVDAVDWPSFTPGKSLATRKASFACLKAISDKAPWVVGGSADLAGSNGTRIGAPALSPEGFEGAQTINFGVREHAMAGICNGMALHKGVLPYSATFLMFHDYQRPSVRLSALMGTKVVYIYTHDSVFLGEDGPTHQPIATLLAMRAIPNMRVLRPGDAAETAECWKLALTHDGPTALVLTRQGLPIVDRDQLASADGTHRGGYVLADTDGAPDVVLLGTGSEVSTLLDARDVLAESGVQARVVSLPCRELFWEQDDAYKASVLPSGVPRISLEAAVTLGWERYVGDNGLCLGIDDFGHSAPKDAIAEHLGFTGAAVAEKVRAFLG